MDFFIGFSIGFSLGIVVGMAFAYFWYLMNKEEKKDG